MHLVMIGVAFGFAFGPLLNFLSARIPASMQRDVDHFLQSYLAGPEARSWPPKFSRSECTLLLPTILRRGGGGRCRGWICEALAGASAALVFSHFGWGWQGMVCAGFVYALCVLALIDVDHKLLPDMITIPLLWVGLVRSLMFGAGVSPSSALLGAVSGYGLLSILFWVTRLANGRAGIGQGDLKLAAGIGAWLGWQTGLVALFGALLAASLIVVAVSLVKRSGAPARFALGPYLAAAGVVGLLYGELAPLIVFKIANWVTHG